MISRSIKILVSSSRCIELEWIYYLHIIEELMNALRLIGNPRIDRTLLSYVRTILIEEMTTFDPCPIAPSIMSTPKHKNAIKASVSVDDDDIELLNLLCYALFLTYETGGRRNAPDIPTILEVIGADYESGSHFSFFFLGYHSHATCQLPK